MLSPERRIELLNRQMTEANNGSPESVALWISKTEVVLRKTMGEKHPALENFRGVSYSPGVWTLDTPDSEFTKYESLGVIDAVNVLKSCVDEVELDAEIASAESSVPNVDLAKDGGRSGSGKVFIVHGRHEAAKLETFRALEALLGTKPIILHEQANRGMVLMEKFELAAADAGFAVVLLTGDDVGGAPGEAPRPRARQNVIFELGFFAGAIGRKNVVVLYDDGVEVPSDLQGLVYVLRDAAGGWRMTLGRELADANYDVNWSALGQM